MKKYFAYLIFASALLFLLPSCDNNGGDVELEEGTLKLTLTCNDLGLTRTENGDDNYKENTIKSIDCYFYKKTDGFNTAAAVVKSIKNIQNAVGSYTANIKFEQTEFEALFDKNATTDQQCLIYVIANYSRTLPIQDNASTPDVVETSIDHLKGLEVESSFDNYTIDDSWSFVMDSKGDATTDVATLSADKKSLTGTIPLYRTAAKITLDINRFGPEETPGYVTLGSDIYKPYIGGIYAVLHNGVKKSTIAPDVVPLAKSEGDYFTRNSLEFTDITTDGKTSHSLKQPLYSYASDWSGESNIEDYVFDPEAYITLVVPWKKVDDVNDVVGDEDDTEDYYYKVPISYRDKKIERNTYYKINISVSILGTLDPNQTVPLTPSYEIIDWSTETIGTNMETFRYLEVEKNHYVMNNVKEIYIPYWSSHECEIVGVTITQPDLRNGGTKKYLTNDKEEADFYKLEDKDYYLDNSEEDKDNKYIKYYLDLDNDYRSDDFDFAPYTITFTIRHKDTDAYPKTVTIVQYPAIYGKLDRNTDADDSGDKNGYVWVNGYQDKSAEGSVPNRYISGTGQGFFAEAHGLSTGSSGVSSTDMLVFTISSVEGTPYVIGDPREEFVNTDFIGEKLNNGNSIWVNAPGVEETASRGLQNYYATDTNHERLKTASNSTNNSTQATAFYSNSEQASANERTFNMIAPKFRISSGYGMIANPGNSDTHYYHLMKKRCASYQEDGYPAGRWRLPTKAEFEFIIYLSFTKKIPDLFSTSLYYWCAHGYGQPNTTNKSVNMVYNTYANNINMISVRCVYDDWYWSSDPVIENKVDSPNDYFIWGDINRASYAPPMNY